MTEEIGEEAQPQNPHESQHRPGKKRQRDGNRPVFRRTGDSMLTDGGCRHQRDNGDRPDGQHAAGAKHSIEQQRRDAGIEPHFRRQPGEQGIGQTLGNQHDGHDQRGYPIADQGVAIVAAPPVKNGQPGRE